MLYRLCGRTAALLRTKTGNDQNGDPELFQDEASRCQSRTRISPFHNTMIWSQSRTSAEHPGPDQSWRKPEDGHEETLYNRALCREQWRKTTAVSNTKAAPSPTENYLKDPFTFTTASRKIAGEGAFSRKNMVWLLIAEMFCQLRCESMIIRKSLNCRNSRSVVTGLKERKWEREGENERKKATKKGRRKTNMGIKMDVIGVSWWVKASGGWTRTSPVRLLLRTLVDVIPHLFLLVSCRLSTIN